MSLNTKLEGSVQISDLALERRNFNGVFLNCLWFFKVGIARETYGLWEDIHLWMS